MDDYFLSSKFLKLLLELLAEPERGIVNDFMGVALADVQGDNLAVLPAVGSVRDNWIPTLICFCIDLRLLHGIVPRLLLSTGMLLQLVDIKIDFGRIAYAC